MNALATVAIVAAAVGVAYAVGSKTDTAKGSGGGYDYTAAVAPLRSAAVGQFKAAFNIDPNTALDPDAATKAGNAIVTQIQTSWNDVELQALADSFAIRGTTLAANGLPAVGQAYADAGKAVTDLAKAVKARNVALGKATGPVVVAGHAPTGRALRRGIQLHSTRGRKAV